MKIYVDDVVIREEPSVEWQKITFSCLVKKDDPTITFGSYCLTGSKLKLWIFKKILRVFCKKGWIEYI